MNQFLKLQFIFWSAVCALTDHLWSLTGRVARYTGQMAQRSDRKLTYATEANDKAHLRVGEEKA